MANSENFLSFANLMMDLVFIYRWYCDGGSLKNSFSALSSPSAS